METSRVELRKILLTHSSADLRLGLETIEDTGRLQTAVIRRHLHRAGYLKATRLTPRLLEPKVHRDNDRVTDHL
jgi:hypothetical protein